MQVSVELFEELHANAVGMFIVENNLSSVPITLRMVSVDHKQDNGSFHVLIPACGRIDFKYQGENFIFERGQIGSPVSSRMMYSNTAIHENIVLFGPSKTSLEKLCLDATNFMTRDIAQKISIYSWDASSDIWMRDSVAPYREFDSVILDSKVKHNFIEDVKEFVSESATRWYKKHGIPCKKGYLLYGPPGTGKTSTIVAMASLLHRKIYRVNLVAPKLSDNSLLRAMNEARPNSIIVMEDIDALFGKFREKKEEFNVTFSGLLNAIDGIGDNSKGMIFMFTSNYPERLDPAIRRKGRIDMEIQMTYCNKVQCEEMFLRFYPGEIALSTIFADNIMKSTKKLTPAQLQHHFIIMRKEDAETASCIDCSMFTVDENDITGMWN